MASKRSVSQRFKAVIELKNQRGANYTEKMRVRKRNMKTCFNIPVFYLQLISVRDKMENILYKEACLVLSKRQVKVLKLQGKVVCTLELSLVKPTDRFGSNYPRLAKEHLRDILLYYNAHLLEDGSSPRYTTSF